MLVAIAGIYCFYLMEVIFSQITHKDKNHQHDHHHEVRKKQLLFTSSFFPFVSAFGLSSQIVLTLSPFRKRLSLTTVTMGRF